MKYSEKTIENVLYEVLSDHPDIYRIWQQPRFATGIPDIVCIFKDADSLMHMKIVEIKKGNIDGEAFAQLLGYMGQASQIVREITDRDAEFNKIYSLARVESVSGWLVGDSITDMAARAVAGLDNVSYVKYSILPGLKIDFDFNADLPELNKRHMHEGLAINLEKMSFERRNRLAYIAQEFYNDGWREHNEMKAELAALQSGIRFDYGDFLAFEFLKDGKLHFAKKNTTGHTGIVTGKLKR